MSAGFQVNSLTINNSAGQVVSQFAASLKACADFNATLLDANRFNGAAGLVANWGFAAPDAGLLIAAFGDLANLALIAHGQRQQVGNNDFFFNAKLLMGTNPL